MRFEMLAFSLTPAKSMLLLYQQSYLCGAAGRRRGLLPAIISAPPRLFPIPSMAVGSTFVWCAGQMNIEPGTSSISGGESVPYPLPTVEELWRVVQEQRQRIDHLEAELSPLPAAGDRAGMGRRPVQRIRRKRRLRFRSEAPPGEALRELAPIIDAYATAPINEGFNWSDCAPRLSEGEWYLVVFRSIRREAIDDLTLEMHDYGAHIEAQRRADGLVFYFRGIPNENRECLSFCLWNSREEAARASQLPLHRVAMSMVNEKYEWYSLERYVVRKAPGSFRIDIEPIASGARG